MAMLESSFTFGTMNSYDDWGIRLIPSDPMIAPKRDRRITIPFRDGSYDYGPKRFNDKIIRLDCATHNRPMSKSEFREVIYWLSRRDKLTLGDEPDKYYMGELMNSPDVHVESNRLITQFVLEMRCDPFAYSSQTVQNIQTGPNDITYSGTAETSTLIIIKNLSALPVSGLQITAIQRMR